MIRCILRWLGLADNEDTSDFEGDPYDPEVYPIDYWEALTNPLTKHVVSPNDTPQAVKHNPVRDPLDKISANLFVGKILDDASIKCKVVDLHKTNMHVNILEIHWPRLGTYLDVGKTYPVHMHDNSILGPDMQIWEISPKHMKRSTSQMVLAWEKDVGWNWDLDM
jgi:hypothetical protein